MAYDPLFDAARKAVDETLGEGEYARLNRNNPGVPAQLRVELNGGPGYWMHETSGVVRPVVEKFLNGNILTSEEIATLRAYLLQWILSPVWSVNPYGDEESRRALWELRVRARHLETTLEIHGWLSDALDLGMDPL